MRTSLGLEPITQYEVDMLSIYNSEECRGLVHTDYWQGKMTALQQRFNLVGFERPEKRQWWDFLRGRKR